MFCINTIPVKFQAETTEILQNLLVHNEQKTKEFCEALLLKLKGDILEPVLKCLAGPDGAKLNYQEIMKSYSAVEEAYKRQAKGAEDICAGVMAKFHPVRINLSLLTWKMSPPTPPTTTTL